MYSRQKIFSYFFSFSDDIKIGTGGAVGGRFERNLAANGANDPLRKI